MDWPNLISHILALIVYQFFFCWSCIYTYKRYRNCGSVFCFVFIFFFPHSVLLTIPICLPLGIVHDPYFNYVLSSLGEPSRLTFNWKLNLLDLYVPRFYGWGAGIQVCLFTLSICLLYSAFFAYQSDQRGRDGNWK